MSDFRIGHGDAVAIGLAADVIYCARIGLLKQQAANRVLVLLQALGFEIYDPMLHAKNSSGGSIILDGLKILRTSGRKTNHHPDPALGQGVKSTRWMTSRYSLQLMICALARSHIPGLSAQK